MIYKLFDLYVPFFTRFISNELMSSTFIILFCMFTFMLVWRLVRGKY